jgi:hypothetical protein
VLRLFAALALLAPGSLAVADVVHLKGGDRITGKVAAMGKKTHRITTPYGRLLVPNEEIERIVYDDGREEVMTAPPAAEVPAAWKTEAVGLEIDIAGDSFWHAWNPKEAPADPTLRFLVTLDDVAVAAYQDAQLDPDIKGAVVNTFTFDPAQTVLTAWRQTVVSPPAVVPGRVHLRLDFPRDTVGPHKLGLSYLWNAGTRGQPDWTELKASTLEMDFRPLGNTVRVEQSRQQMSFGGVLAPKRMKKIETFRVQIFPGHDPATAQPEAAAPPATPAP